MPTTINGIGTHYYGKRNVEKRSGQCGSCGRVGDLQTYDTGLWFCVIFIPLIPLGKKRVLDKCPACGRHGQIGAKQWEEARGKAIRESQAEYEAAPDDPDKAVALHATLDSGGEREAAGKFADILLDRFPDNADVQLYLGGCFEESNQLERSNRCFHRAYEIDPTNHQHQQASALALLREGDVAGAQARIKQAIDSGKQVDPGLTFSIANALNAANDPTGAGELLDALAQQTPQVRKQKPFRQLAKKVEQATGANSGSLAPRRSVFATPGFWWGAAAVAVLAGLTARDIYLASNQPVYVVNGLPVPITFSLDGGEPMTAHNGRPARVPLAGGAHTVAVTAPAELAGDVSFNIQSGRWDRWFGSPLHVVDPTRSAVVLWEETIFSENPVAGDNDYVMVVGKQQTTFDDADYHFAEFPDQIEVSDSATQVRKSRVGQLADLGPMLLVLNDPTFTDDPATLDYIEPHLLFLEDSEQLLELYVSAGADHGQLERCFQFLKSHSAKTPVDLTWRRVLLHAAELCNHDLRPEYDALVAANPNDADLLYLRSRLETQRRAADGYLRRALEADPEHLRALTSAAWDEALAGRFEEAIETAGRALAVDREFSDAVGLRDPLLIATGRQDELERKLRPRVDEPPFNPSATMMLVSCFATVGNEALARGEHAALVEKIQEAWPSDPHQLAARSEFHLHHALQDWDAAERAARSISDADSRDRYLLICALAKGDAARAEPLARSQPMQTRGQELMWTSLASVAQGDAATAERLRQDAADELSKYGGNSAAIARLLGDSLTPQQLATDSLELRVDVEVKAAVLLLNADRAGDQRDALIDLATRLSLLPSYHQPVLKNALAAMGG